jgi:hypothetical protein
MVVRTKGTRPALNAIRVRSSVATRTASLRLRLLDGLHITTLLL